jgi:hypothetical protein
MIDLIAARAQRAPIIVGGDYQGGPHRGRHRRRGPEQNDGPARAVNIADSDGNLR